MSRRIAVIDLGTNTFHLLVAELTTHNTFKAIYRKRHFVKLAADGIQKIGKAPWERGLKALGEFKQSITELRVTKVVAIGTAALRTASNGAAFIQMVQQKTGISIQLIDGHQEAKYIHKGVTLAVPFQATNFLIMDIGGGSVEFIIANESTIHWADSFPIGVGVLYKHFHHHDPITPEEVQATLDHIAATLQPLQAALNKYPATTLVGASGTFDVIETLLAKEKNNTHAYVSAKDFPPFYQLIVQSDLQALRAHEGIPNERVDMIVVAVILVDYILKSAGIEEIIVSRYAMKEGILREALERHDKKNK